MGWTRNRAVQVLGELETAGLLTSYPGRGPGGGRVKFFALNDTWRPT
jgi:DNA-binding IscR family transcriptional regulator